MDGIHPLTAAECWELLRAGPRLAGRLDGQVVAFEIDDVDPARSAGWSVVVTGTARVPQAVSELARLDAVPLEAWAGAEHVTPIWLTPGDVQGRRIEPAPTAAVV